MKTIKISEETYEKLKDQLGEDKVDVATYDDLIGKKWFFRTITYHLVGRVVKRVGTFLLLEDASWVADSGRFMNCVKDGTLDEVEPVGEIFVNLESVGDFFLWKHALPKDQK
jgi:hypothetical protein